LDRTLRALVRDTCCSVTARHAKGATIDDLMFLAPLFGYTDKKKLQRDLNGARKSGAIKVIPIIVPAMRHPEYAMNLYTFR
jgi:hypothetical protein